MRLMLTFLAISALTITLPACHKNQSAADQNNVIATNSLMNPPADVEVLPPDESAGNASEVANADLDDNDENDVD